MFDASFLKDFFIHFWLHPQMWSLKKNSRPNALLQPVYSEQAEAWGWEV